MMYGKQILILIPHPDDEVVACATAIKRAISTGAEVFGLYLTHGCIPRDAMWPWDKKNYDKNVAQRQAEAEKAALFLGIEPAEWSDRPARHLWQNMDHVYEEIQQVIAVRNCDQLWVPAYEGGNPDHDALNAIGQKFTAKLRVLEFAEYNFQDDKTNAQTFPKPNGREQTIILTDAERQFKCDALALYKSERANLNYVGVKQESFRRLEDYDYSKPPHEGMLWYTRFQWVPLHHPRVDFTDPADVSKAITQFLARHT